MNFFCHKVTVFDLIFDRLVVVFKKFYVFRQFVSFSSLNELYDTDWNVIVIVPEMNPYFWNIFT